MKFTIDQQKVIDTRNRNLLVSAAAGSGKTAVLVERIIRMITHESSPVPITKLLVVTFTNAAAAEMRERIGKALYQEIEKNPSNAYLQQQLALLPSATIMTLHAFCLKVIKNHFYRIDLDPGFTIGEEGELALLRQEAMAETLENFYNEGSEAFHELIEAYAPGKSDQALESLVWSLYTMSRSHPRPHEWLSESLHKIYFRDLNHWYESVYMAYISRQILEEALYVRDMCVDTLAMTEEDPGLAPMAITIRQYMEIAEELLGMEKDTESLLALISSFELQRAKSAKRGTDKALSEPVKQARESIKDRLTKLKDSYSFDFNHRFIEQMQMSHGHMTTLVQVVQAYGSTFRGLKEDRNLMDFNDIEHFALAILRNSDGSATEVAQVYRKQFHEILVDEYQDSNLVQETLINSVARVEEGQPNVFMVGDMKQSIYKFRLARPELFADKYDTYSFEEGDYQKLELHKNFRSRQQVVDMTNYLFAQLMSRKVGDVTYDDHAALHQGAAYELEGPAYGTEVLLIERGGDKRTAAEIEGEAVAVEIENLMHREPPVMVYDKQINTTRKLMYKDVVVLMRVMTGWSETFVRILKDHGIPVSSNTSTGYFDTIEIQTVMNVLRIIDNPKQDIPLVAVLRSPMFSFTGDDLVTIRLSHQQLDFHSALMVYAKSSFGQNDLDRKVQAFVALLDKWRQQKNEAGIYNLVKTVFEDTGYDNYMALTRGGSQRSSNLDMFLGQVYQYERSSYRGLFHFIRYMENIRKQSIDYGEAAMEEDSRDQVTIMSIHGSKGLEFPVVILSALGKQFNTMDLKQSVLMHQTYGFGTERILVDARQKLPSPVREVIKQVMEGEMLSEELRILYVALTRAREKLILTGAVKDLEKSMNTWSQKIRSGKVPLDVQSIKGARSYLDWLMLGILRHEEGRKLLAELEIYLPLSLELDDMSPELTIRTGQSGHISQVVEGPENKVIDEVPDPEAYRTYEEKMAWQYGEASLTTLKLSQSVSDLKRLEAQEEVAYQGPVLEQSAYRPLFITGEQPLTGAERGTIFHKVMDHLDLKLSPRELDLEGLLNSLVDNKVLTEKERKTIRSKAVYQFLESDLGTRVRRSAKRGLAYQEKPFVMGIPVESLTGQKANTFTMVQGVIDLHFEEEGKLILVDYKTDYAKDQDDSVFIQRYKGQMTYYKKALEQEKNMEVSEIWLYIAGSGRAIPVVL